MHARCKAIARSSKNTKIAVVITWMLIQLIGLGWLLADHAYGQAAQPKYETIEPFQPNWYTDKSTVSRIKQIRGKITTDPSALEDPAMVDFFRKIYDNDFASMTHPTEFKNIAARKAQILKEIDNANRRGNSRAHAGLVKISFDKCKQIAEGNYHPISRINALLMIGELNEKEMNSLQKQPPIAYKPAFDVFLAVLVVDAENKFNDGMKVAAMHGLKRHIMLNSDAWTPAQQDQVADLMLGIAESACPSNRDPEGHGWMQGIAIDNLLLLNNPRDPRPKKLAALVFNSGAKEEASGHILVHTARSVPKLQVPQDFVPETENILKQWAGRLASSVGKEAAKLERLDVSGPALPASILGAEVEDLGDDSDDDLEEEMSFSGFGGAAAQSPEVIRARRLLTYMLESIRTGLAGTAQKASSAEITSGLVAATSDEALKAQAQKLLDVIDRSITRVNNEKFGSDEEFAESLRVVEKNLTNFDNPDADADGGGDDDSFPAFPADPLGYFEAPGEPSVRVANAAGSN